MVGIFCVLFSTARYKKGVFYKTKDLIVDYRKPCSIFYPQNILGGELNTRHSERPLRSWCKNTVYVGRQYKLVILPRAFLFFSARFDRYTIHARFFLQIKKSKAKAKSGGISCRSIFNSLISHACLFMLVIRWQRQDIEIAG